MSDLVWSSRAGRIATANSVNLRGRFLLLRGPVDVIPTEADELRTLIQHEMEHVAGFSVPIVAEVGLGPNWRDIK
jgi:hypothetical protein